MTGESNLAALQWRRPSCVPSEKTASGRRPLMPSSVNSREFSLIPREFRASVPPCTAPAALHFQGDPQTDAAAAAEVPAGRLMGVKPPGGHYPNHPRAASGITTHNYKGRYTP